MTYSKKSAIDEVIKVEGGLVYTDDPDDSGGETFAGITKDTAKMYGYTGSMKLMTYETVFSIYSSMFWDRLNGDDLLKLSPAVCQEVFDTEVNIQTGEAATFLQRWLNVFNRDQRLYPDIVVDRVIGQQTLAALELYLEERSEKVLVRALNASQGNYYLTLAERRMKDEKWIYGWMKNRVSI